MPRRKISTLLVTAATFLVAVTVQASDFWLTKDWKQWSKDECAGMLSDSPWVHTWRSGDQSTEIAFVIQLRSSLPVREAIIRQLQFEQKYDKLSADQRASFDMQAGQILNRNYDDTILVEVDCAGENAPRLGADLHAYVQKSGVNLDASLITDDGTPIPPTGVDWNPKLAGFILRFPRIKDGVPIIKDGQKHFAVQFLSPTIGGGGEKVIPGRRVRSEFDLAKMLVNGKPNF
jgi:hypothetical protein